MTDITLPEAIGQLRADLALAQQQGEGQQIRLAVQEVQIELSIVAKLGAEAGGGIKAWVIDASAKGSKARESGHKIILKLEARSGEGELLISSVQGDIS